MRQERKGWSIDKTVPYLPSKENGHLGSLKPTFGFKARHAHGSDGNSKLPMNTRSPDFFPYLSKKRLLDFLPQCWGYWDTALFPLGLQGLKGVPCKHSVCLGAALELSFFSVSSSKWLLPPSYRVWRNGMEKASPLQRAKAVYREQEPVTPLQSLAPHVWPYAWLIADRQFYFLF